MHKIKKIDEKSLEYLHTKILYCYIHKSKEKCKVHTQLFIPNEETNNKKFASFDIKNENTEYVCCSDLKLDCFTKENFTLIISHNEL